VFACDCIGKPDAPRKLSVTACTENTVGLKWEAPQLDGGSPVTGYVVEMRPTNRAAWSKVAATQRRELAVGELQDGSEYVFRVAAQNAVGVGEYVQLQQPALTKSTAIGEHAEIACLAEPVIR